MQRANTLCVRPSQKVDPYTVFPHRFIGTPKTAQHIRCSDQSQMRAAAAERVCQADGFCKPCRNAPLPRNPCDRRVRALDELAGMESKLFGRLAGCRKHPNPVRRYVLQPHVNLACHPRGTYKLANGDSTGPLDHE